MLDLLGLALGSLLGNLLGGQPSALQPVPLVSWQEAKLFDVPTQPDATVANLVESYLQDLAKQGFSKEHQGIWIQSEWAELANNREEVPVAAASLTKIATTIAALEKWGADHRFVTGIYTTGAIDKGVLQGDLVIEGGGDPLFVWEEGIALGNALNELGIRQVKGNLIVTGNFAMNFASKPQVAGEWLKQAVNERLWTPLMEKQYKTLPGGTKRPQVAISGTVEVQPTLPPKAQLLLRHQSLPLAELLKQMNIYSNNGMAEMLAESVGGAQVVAGIAAKFARISPQEIQLENGSGLSVNNRLSPYAVSQMLIALERQLANQPIKITDLFPVAGYDKKGTLKWRNIPDGIAVKTGTLAQVSALAGVIPTKERGLVWFTIINQGGNIDKLRAEQDKFLQGLAQHWQITFPVMNSPSNQIFLGDPSRNLKI
jgi:D-alanyl-D-alanine carboxypeptidase/D-alanyl-D-alanine-endopeptidase (penicillin-binding protein 4)